MRSKIAPYEGRPYTLDVVRKRDSGKTLAFRNELHRACALRFNASFRRFLKDCSKAERAQLTQEKKRLFFTFFAQVNERLLQVIGPATEDIAGNLKRGKKRLELQSRVNVRNLVNTTPIPMPRLVVNALRRHANRVRSMSGKKVSGERQVIYDRIERELSREKSKTAGKRRRKSEVIRNLCQREFKDQDPIRLRKAYDYYLKTKKKIK